jgi:hypothetical protein
VGACRRRLLEPCPTLVEHENPAFAGFAAKLNIAIDDPTFLFEWFRPERLAR